MAESSPLITLRDSVISFIYIADLREICELYLQFI